MQVGRLLLFHFMTFITVILQVAALLVEVYVTGLRSPSHRVYLCIPSISFVAYHSSNYLGYVKLTCTLPITYTN